MSSNLFQAGMNAANLDLGNAMGEGFELVTGGKNTPLVALSIREISSESKLAPGGLINVGDVVMQVLKSVWDGAGIQDGAKLVIRGKRFRLNSKSDTGTNAYKVVCGPTAVKLT